MIPKKAKKPTKSWTSKAFDEFDDEGVRNFHAPTEAEKLLKEYPPPRGEFRDETDQKIFDQYWKVLLPEIAGRDNFKLGHTFQLEKLCKIYVWSVKLERDIQQSGWTYLSEGRNGVQQKTSPEVAQYNEFLRRIEGYTKMLGLTLYKDKKTGSQKGEAAEEWE